MPSHEDMVAAVEAYVRGFATGDVDMICSLFAADAIIEDPVGSSPHVGASAVRRFYQRIIDEGGAKLELAGPVRTAANAAVFAFSSHLRRGGVARRIDPIDVFEFDDQGKVKVMRAYWGPANLHETAVNSP
jgi:steroid delta-isomerase